MNWFRIFVVAAAVCATVGIGIWAFYGLAGATWDDGAATVAISAGLLALVSASAAGVTAINRNPR